MSKPKSQFNPAYPLVQRNGTHRMRRTLPAPEDWSAMSKVEHFAQFYENDSFLLRSLNGYVGTGLRAGETVLVVGTKPHREGLEQLLGESGVDVGAAQTSGQYCALDAAETLSEFLIDGLPDPERFTAVVGGLVEHVVKKGSGVRIFGEMVALLWEAENYEGAIRLEELWNDLQKARSFALFCAYPINQCSGETRSKSFIDVCVTHSRIIPAESYMALNNQDDRLSAIIELQRQSRSLQAEIKERQEAEERLRISLLAEQTARAEAESANRMKDEFLATVSHELRTPLNAIIGWSHMLVTGKLDEPTAARALTIIDRNAKAQAQLIEDILDVSRVITGKLRLEAAPLDVAAVINAAIDSAQVAADSKGIQLEVTLDPSARHIVGDFGRLQQVVWNLLSNAIKFTPAGGRVDVRLARADRSVEIRVSDTGQGINPLFLPFVFDRFRQADGSETRSHGGLGLGLAIVRHLVELHGGTVSADSGGLGCGATFSIALPLVPVTPMVVETGRPGDLARTRTDRADLKLLTSLDGVRLLVVDDDRDTLQVLAVLLSESKARVETATSASDALTILQGYTPDVLVLDLAMPGEDGYSLIRKVRESDVPAVRQVPAVALTAHVRVEERARALSAGFNLFVPKPVEPSELITAIANLAGLSL